jgi:hypothetical protein
VSPATIQSQAGYGREADIKFVLLLIYIALVWMTIEEAAAKKR